MLLVPGLTTYSTPSDADIAAARERVDARVADVAATRARCLADPDRGTDLPLDVACGAPLSAEDVPLEPYLDAEPYVFARDAGGAAATAGLLTALAACLIGLRGRGRPVVTSAVGAGALALAGQVLALGSAGLLARVAGPAEEVPGIDWSRPDLVSVLLGAAARSVLLAVLVAVLGLGLARLARGRVPVVAAVLVGWAAVETVVRLMAPVLSPWLPFANAAALLAEDGLFIEDPGAPIGPADTVPGFEVGHLHAAVLLTVYALAVLAAARSTRRSAPRGRDQRDHLDLHEEAVGEQ